MAIMRYVIYIGQAKVAASKAETSCNIVVQGKKALEK